ncbi:MAG TPA: phytanoyl-CoA dioxygenase family protein [Ilumatobacteraceae bacterium]|nr:phytanoyl-CoA dioxygenase family protein [Ilumatobacteraceae bacterium]
MNLEHFPSDIAPEEVGEHLRRYGYAIVDDLADAATMDQLDHEVTDYIDASDAGRDEYDGRHTRRTGALIARCPTARRLVMHPTAVGAAQHLLSQATTIQLHLTQVITISPGETQQKLHRDQMAFDFFPFPADYHVQCNTMWALTDFNEENGATHILPGTSSMDDESGRLVAGAQATMRRGSCLFYEGKVLHGGGANRSDRDRRGVNITYAVGWVRQEENQYLATPPEVARTLDDDLLRMMGYQQGAFALGYVGDQQDPLAFLRGEPIKVKVISDIVRKNDDIRSFVDQLATERTDQDGVVN